MQNVEDNVDDEEIPEEASTLDENAEMESMSTRKQNNKKNSENLLTKKKSIHFLIGHNSNGATQSEIQDFQQGHIEGNIEENEGVDGVSSEGEKQAVDDDLEVNIF